MRECGKKIKRGNEVVRKICQNKYKKNVTENKWLFSVFVWITFGKAITTSPLKII